LVGPYIILQAIEDNRINLFIRSRKVRNRGKVLFEIKDILVSGNGPRLVDTFEWTIDQAQGFKDGVPDPERVALIADKW
jgi:hypothetical protein